MSQGTAFSAAGMSTVVIAALNLYLPSEYKDYLPYLTSLTPVVIGTIWFGLAYLLVLVGFASQDELVATRRMRMNAKFLKKEIKQAKKHGTHTEEHIKELQQRLLETQKAISASMSN
ncbi:hypothetical protein VB891_002298 [Vibrio cholerae]|nr:hypothetical protein [Vibrio cholerae]